MNQGHSLLELLFVIAIMTLLTCMAYPTLHQQMVHMYRLEGQLALLDLANRMEHYRMQHSTYQKASIGTGKSSDVLSTDSTEHGHYTLSIIQSTQTSYTLQATARFADQECRLLTYDHSGHKSASPTKQSETCWR